MFEEVIKSTQSHLNERLSSPLMGSFAFAWCLWNYKFLVVLFSAASVSQTFNLIDVLIFPDKTTIFLRGILYPLVSAFAYIFLYPYPAKVVYWFSHNRKKEINEIRRRIEDETPLTLKESRQIRIAASRMESEHAQEIDRKNREIERVNGELIMLRASSPEDAEKPLIEDRANSLEPTQLFMLHLVDKNGGEVSEDVILSQSPESKVKTEFDLGELVKLQLLTRKYEPRQNEFVFKFTHEGRGVLLASQVNAS